MESNWVYKADGTIQCEEEPKATSLDEMAKELINVLGEDAIIQKRKLHRPTVKMCGVPTGAINAYELSTKAFALWKDGVVGKLEFIELEPEFLPKELSVEDSLAPVDDLSARKPERINELVGHPLRTYITGEPITMDYRPNRFNIELSAMGNRAIVSVWFG